MQILNIVLLNTNDFTGKHLHLHFGCFPAATVLPQYSKDAYNMMQIQQKHNFTISCNLKVNPCSQVVEFGDKVLLNWTRGSVAAATFEERKVITNENCIVTFTPAPPAHAPTCNWVELKHLGSMVSTTPILISVGHGQLVFS